MECVTIEYQCQTAGACRRSDIKHIIPDLGGLGCVAGDLVSRRSKSSYSGMSTCLYRIPNPLDRYLGAKR